MTPIPILFVGDSPDLHTGLARIGRDLATLLCRHPEFRVGYFGRGGIGNRHLPFFQYNYDPCRQWGEAFIQQVWHDFAGDLKGIVFTIWDASRLTWFGLPQGVYLPAFENFLLQPPFLRWGYFPVDATGPGDRLTTMSAQTVKRYDRVLGYGAFGAGVLQNSIGKPVDFIPHGFKAETFQPRDRKAARMAFNCSEKELVIGCCMSNQPRKDWGLAFAIISHLRSNGAPIRFLVHTDVLERSHAWSLHALVHDMGLQDHVRISLSGTMTDEELSYWYSACDITILPSLGEGFGYPIIESLACGTPCIHGKYGGGVELIPRDEWLVAPLSWRMEGLHSSVRPVFDPVKWAEAIACAAENQRDSDFCRESVIHLDWARLWPSAWQKWFLEGIHAKT